jgi:hypothetical protein
VEVHTVEEVVLENLIQVGVQADLVEEESNTYLHQGESIDSPFFI